MTAALTKLRTFARLGPANGIRVLAYRLALKLGVHPVQRITTPESAKWLFDRNGAPAQYFNSQTTDPAPASAPSDWRTEHRLFGIHSVAFGNEPPAWTLDPLSTKRVETPDPDAMLLSPWWMIADFAGGDIKQIWELSRLDWAVAFAQQARDGDSDAIDRLNNWLNHWIRSNPPYRGPNWKCAQEASIRIFHLSIAALILGVDKSPILSDALAGIIDIHVQRILPTLSYARAQDNNHATSEAAALFIAGAWLMTAGRPEGPTLAHRAKRLLEKHVLRLCSPDGSFSQHSLNYHRFFLDTLSLVEVWRSQAALPAFSVQFRSRAAAAADWLRTMVDLSNGDAPNLGANDGANLLPLTDAPYRDYRPSVQLATALYLKARAYPPGRWDEALAWLGVLLPTVTMPSPIAMKVFDDGGYAVLREGAAMALLRYPRFRFRPSQADALHVDLRLAGTNLLRDDGSYSYNTEPRWLDYFGSAGAHNTIEFDDAPQMPRVSRFLFGDWLATADRGPVMSDEGRGFYAAYRHPLGWWHRRELRLSAQRLLVRDDVADFKHHAVLRWRLKPGDWRLTTNGVTDGFHRVSITAENGIDEITLTEGWESRHYLDKAPLPVLEVKVTRPGWIATEYRWTS